MKLLRKALEEHTEEDKTIVMKGPLAEIFAKALDVAYAKNDPLTARPVDGIAAPEGTATPSLESQAQDAQLLQKVAEALVPPDQVSESALTIYGTSAQTISQADIVNVAKDLASGISEDGGYALIIDATQPGPNGPSSSVPSEEFDYLSSALECLVLSHGGKVYHSLNEFAQAF